MTQTAKKASGLRHGIVMAQRNGLFNYFAWPTVARLPDGSLMTVCSGGRMAHVDPFGQIVASRSYDEGDTWTAPAVLYDSPLDDRDAGLCVQGGRVYITSFTNSRETQRAHIAHEPWLNDGQIKLMHAYLDLITDETERKHLCAFYLSSSDGGRQFAEARPVPLTAPHGMIPLSDGTLLFVGAAFRDDCVHRETDLASGIYRAVLHADGTWTSPVPFRFPPEAKGLAFYEPHGVQLPSGRIVAVFRAQTPDGRVFTVWQSVSDDGGTTFSEPRPLGVEGSPPHLMVHSSGALVLSYGRRKPPFGIRARISLDGGETYGEEIVLRDDGLDPDIGYPSTTELRDGALLTVYYYRESYGIPGSDILYTKWRINA